MKISYSYYDNKARDTVLFLHGWGCNKHYFKTLISKNRIYNSLLVDIPGFGNSHTLQKPYTLSEFANEIYDFLHYNGFKVTYIVGHSFGGKLSVLLNEKINAKGMILLAPSIFKKMRGILYYLKIFIYKTLKNIKIFNFITSKMGSKDYKTLPPTLKKTMTLVINQNIKNRLKYIHCPVYLLFGKKDKITPIYLGYKVKKHITNCFIIKINGDHFAYLINKQLIINLLKVIINHDNS